MSSECSFMLTKIHWSRITNNCCFSTSLQTVQEVECHFTLIIARLIVSMRWCNRLSLTSTRRRWKHDCFCGLISSSLQLPSTHPYLYSRKKWHHSKHNPVMLALTLSCTWRRLDHGSSHSAPLQQTNPTIWVITDQTGTANRWILCTRKTAFTYKIYEIYQIYHHNHRFC